MTAAQAAELIRIGAQIRNALRLLAMLVGVLIVMSMANLMPASAATQADREAAIHDRRHLDQAALLHTYYFTVSDAPLNQREAIARQLAFVASSVSRQPVLDYTIPYNLPGTNLFRIDLRLLKWDRHDFAGILKQRYPYDPVNVNPLVISAKWFVVEATDANASDTYYRLLYGGRKIPKTLDDFLNFWGVDSRQVQLRFGLIEGNSGVSKQRIRWIENRPIVRGYAWGTRDFFEIKPGSDPLEQPAGDFKYDAGEWILGVPKVSLLHQVRCNGQVYFLENGAGKRIDKADGDLVEDATHYRGYSQIRTSGSCIQCHVEGLNPPTVNEFKSIIVQGVDVYADPLTQEALDRFHGGSIGKDLARNSEDYSTFVKACNGLAPKDNATEFKTVVDRYDKDVDAAQAALELGDITAVEFRLALAFASARGISIGTRLSGLERDVAIPRTSWEASYPLAFAATKLWRESKRGQK